MNLKTKKDELGEHMKSEHRREKPLDWDGAKVVVTDGKSIVEAMDIRCYYTPSRVYVCVWLSLPYEGGGVIPAERKVSGSAFAGGYGYDKQDAAIQAALGNMGIRIDQKEWPSGSGEWQEACEQIVRNVYPDNCLVKTIKVFS